RPAWRESAAHPRPTPATSTASSARRTPRISARPTGPTPRSATRSRRACQTRFSRTAARHPTRHAANNASRPNGSGTTPSCIRPGTRPGPRAEASGSSGAAAGPATRVRPEPSYYDRGGRPASLHGRAPASRSSDDFSGREPGQEVTQRQDEHTILPEPLAAEVNAVGAPHGLRGEELRQGGRIAAPPAGRRLHLDADTRRTPTPHEVDLRARRSPPVGEPPPAPRAVHPRAQLVQHIRLEQATALLAAQRLASAAGECTNRARVEEVELRVRHLLDLRSWPPPRQPDPDQGAHEE